MIEQVKRYRKIENKNSWP